MAECWKQEFFPVALACQVFLINNFSLHVALFCTTAFDSIQCFNARLCVIFIDGLASVWFQNCRNILNDSLVWCFLVRFTGYVVVMLSFRGSFGHAFLPFLKTKLAFDYTSTDVFHKKLEMSFKFEKLVLTSFSSEVFLLIEFLLFFFSS